MQQTHGLLSCAQWTGVPVSWLLDEAGRDAGRQVGAVRGCRRLGHTRCVPLEKVLDDCLIVYAQNGEMLRPEQGYPLRAVRARAGKATSASNGCGASRSATSRGTSAARRRATPTRCRTASGASSASMMECKSVITRPSGGMKIAARACTRSRASPGRATARSARSTSPSTAARPGGRRGSKSRCSTSA